MNKAAYAGHITQHPDETKAYVVSAKNYDTPIVVSSMEAWLFKDESDSTVTVSNATDVTSTKLTGVSSVSGTDITTEQVTAVTIGQSYYIYIFFTANGNGPILGSFSVEGQGETEAP